MATATTEKKATEKKIDRVEVFIPRGSANADPNYFVSVNGVNYLLPRGQKSLVPAHIAREVNRALDAETNLYKIVEEMSAPK